MNILEAIWKGVKIATSVLVGLYDAGVVNVKETGKIADGVKVIEDAIEDAKKP